MPNYNSTLQSNNTDLQAILNTINELPEAGGEQATPVISINSTNGLITATAGDKSSTHQLAFQAAKTITPTTTSQTAVESNTYTGGAVTIAAIPNTYVQPTGTKSITENGTHDVKSYASVNVSVASSGGGEIEIIVNNMRAIGENAFYGCTSLTTISFPAATIIGRQAFCECTSLTVASFPAATTIGDSAFCYCSSLTTISFPVATSIGENAFCSCSSLTVASFPSATTVNKSAFYGCTNLTVASFPAATTIGSQVFYGCTNLTVASFPAVTTIGSYAFYKCFNLKSLYLTGSSVCKLSNSNAFSSTPIGGYSTSAGTYGAIYVPASLLTSYQTATNWTYFSSRFVGV